MDNEAVWRLGAFAAIFTTMAVFELVAPRLQRDDMRGALKTKRWFTNISMVVLSTIALRIVFPTAAVGVGIWAGQENIGLFNMFGVPVLVAGLASFVILDFAVWLEHLVSHKFPPLWRIHRMHHSDNGFDLTTALRFHPLEIVISIFWKALVILAIGAPVLSILVFEIVLNGMAMFNHANVRLPLKLDRFVRMIFVTPDMHRVHHSTIQRETDSNYGFNLSIWDRIFSTYNDQPEKGHEGMTIGLEEYQTAKTWRLDWALLVPFRK